MQLPRTALGQFCFFAAMEAISFAVIVANTRAIAQVNYFWTALTDIGFGIQAFALFKLAVDDPKGRTWASGLGSTIGGTIGSILSLWVTTKIYGG